MREMRENSEERTQRRLSIIGFFIRMIEPGSFIWFSKVLRHAGHEEQGVDQKYLQNDLLPKERRDCNQNDLRNETKRNRKSPKTAKEKLQRLKTLRAMITRNQ